MELHFTWKTKLFSRKFEIYDSGTLAGSLEKERWSRKVSGEIHGFSIMFVTKGFFRQTTGIINRQDETETGRITFNYWKHKASIQLNYKDYDFGFDNFFMTRWRISNENGVIIKYHSSPMEGTIESFSDNSVLILTGLFIRNYFKRRQAAAAAG